jgi:hypothetical protein
MCNSLYIVTHNGLKEHFRAVLKINGVASVGGEVFCWVKATLGMNQGDWAFLDVFILTTDVTSDARATAIFLPCTCSRDDATWERPNRLRSTVLPCDCSDDVT